MKHFHLKSTLTSWTIGILLLSSWSAQAGFVSPPYVGQANSTSSSWSYNGDWAAGSSASHMNSFTTVAGYPLTNHDGGCGAGMACLSTSDNGSTLHFYIPNFVDPLRDKLLRIQFMFEPAPVGNPLGVSLSAFDPLGAVSAQLEQVSSNTETINGINYTFGIQDWRMKPNPDWEVITITNANFNSLRAVQIDTISTVPEPGSLWLVNLALLGLAGVWRAKRQ